MNPMSKIVPAALLVLCSTLAWAEQPSAAQALVQDTTGRLITMFKVERATSKENPDRLIALAKEITLPHFDVERISSWVLGKYWRSASVEQKKRFSEEFVNFVLRSYATAVNDYTGEITGKEITYLPFKAAPGADDVTVKTEVHVPDRPPVPINYRLRLKGGEWKVYDVTVEGTSLVTNYRNSFAREIRQGGLDALIDKLATRNKQNVASTKQ